MLQSTFVAVVALSLGACGITYRASADVLDVYLTSDPTILEVGVDACNANTMVQAVESAAEVVVTATAVRRLDGAGDECRDSVFVHLEQPVGDRVVVDGRTGDELVVQPAD